MTFLRVYGELGKQKGEKGLKYRFCYRTKEGFRFNTLFESETSDRLSVLNEAIATAQKNDWELKAIEQVQ